MAVLLELPDVVYRMLAFQIGAVKNMKTGIRQISGILRYCQYRQARLMSDSHMEKPVENSIKQKLTEALQPSILEVINESYMHSVPKGSFNLDQSKIFLCGNGLRINHYRPTPVTSAISSGGANMTTGMSEVTKGSETHFKAVVVTEKFDQLPLIKRHRMVNQLLDEELKAGVHALSITAKTPKQWEDSGGKIGKSPPCRGGAGL